MKEYEAYTSFIKQERDRYRNGSMTDEEYSSFVLDLQRLRSFRISSIIGPDQPYQGVKYDGGK